MFTIYSDSKSFSCSSVVWKTSIMCDLGTKLFPKHHTIFMYCIDEVHIEWLQVIGFNVAGTRSWYRSFWQNLLRTTARSRPVHLGKTLEVKLNEALLHKVRRGCRVGRLRLSRCEMCVCVFRAIVLEEMWKTQSPPVSMETSSRSQAERHREPFLIRNQGCEVFHIIARMLLTTDNNVLGRMTISSAVTLKRVNLLKPIKMNRVVRAANICT